MHRANCLKLLFCLVGVSFGWPSALSAAETKSGNLTTGVVWHNDYSKAMSIAERQERMLLVYFCNPHSNGPCNRFKKETLSAPQVQEKLQAYVCVQLPLTAKIKAGGKDVVLLEDAAFQEMLGRPGIAIIDFRSSDAKLRGAVVSTFPITEKLGTRRKKWW